LADVLILPGSKQTLDDLAWLRACGLAEAIAAHPGWIIGICGGFQMLGSAIEDPEGVENAGRANRTTGLGLLPAGTVMRGEKTVRRVTGEAGCWSALSFRGYEIHMGETVYPAGCLPFAKIVREGGEAVADGAVSPDRRIWGTYVHGIFDDD